jgi:hypothetical protein
MKPLMLIILLPTFSLAQDCRTSAIIAELRPGASWSMDAENIDTLKWLDTKQTQPDKQDVLNLQNDCQIQKANREDLKKQARLTLKDASATTDEKVNALTLLLDFDE